jgi:hypothetical protein
MTISLVDIRIVDPAGRDTQRCIRAYFAELNRRSELGFDPTAGISGRRGGAAGLAWVWVCAVGAAAGRAAGLSAGRSEYPPDGRSEYPPDGRSEYPPDDSG